MVAAEIAMLGITSSNLMNSRIGNEIGRLPTWYGICVIIALSIPLLRLIYKYNKDKKEEDKFNVTGEALRFFR